MNVYNTVLHVLSFALTITHVHGVHTHKVSFVILWSKDAMRCNDAFSLHEVKNNQKYGEAVLVFESMLRPRLLIIIDNRCSVEVLLFIIHFELYLQPPALQLVSSCKLYYLLRTQISSCAFHEFVFLRRNVHTRYRNWRHLWLLLCKEGVNSVIILPRVDNFNSAAQHHLLFVLCLSVCTISFFISIYCFLWY